MDVRRDCDTIRSQWVGRTVNLLWLQYSTMVVSFLCSCRPTEYPYWYGMLTPFGIIYLFNWTMFVIIMISVVNRTRKTANLTVNEKSSISKAKKLVLVAAGLSIIFGLGWGIGIITLITSIADEDEVKFALEVIFSLLIGVQGVLIFVFHGVRSKEARKQWNSWFSHLPCLRHRRQKTWYTSTNSSRNTGTNTLSVTGASTLKREPEKGDLGNGTMKGPVELSPEIVALRSCVVSGNWDEPTSPTVFTNLVALHDPECEKAAKAEDEANEDISTAL